MPRKVRRLNTYAKGKTEIVGVHIDIAGKALRRSTQKIFLTKDGRTATKEEKKAAPKRNAPPKRRAAAAKPKRKTAPKKAAAAKARTKKRAAASKKLTPAAYAEKQKIKAVVREGKGVVAASKGLISSKTILSAIKIDKKVLAAMHPDQRKVYLAAQRQLNKTVRGSQNSIKERLKAKKGLSDLKSILRMKKSMAAPSNPLLLEAVKRRGDVLGRRSAVKLANEEIRLRNTARLISKMSKGLTPEQRVMLEEAPPSALGYGKIMGPNAGEGMAPRVGKEPSLVGSTVVLPQTMEEKIKSLTQTEKFLTAQTSSSGKWGM